MSFERYAEISDRLICLGCLITQLYGTLCADDHSVDCVAFVHEELVIIALELGKSEIAFAPCSVVKKRNAVGNLDDSARHDVPFALCTRSEAGL